MSDEHTAARPHGMPGASLKGRDFLQASSGFGDRDTTSGSSSCSEDYEAAGGKGRSPGGGGRAKPKSRSRTLERVSRALSPYVALSIPARAARNRSASNASASSEDVAGGIGGSESAVAAEPQGQGMFGVRQALRRTLSHVGGGGGGGGGIYMPGEGGCSGDPTDSDSSRCLDDSHDDIAHLIEYSEKTSAQVHRLFPELSSAECHVDDYTCAIQKEILIHGRLYLTSDHLCFLSSILGYITRIVLPLSSIASMEKRSVFMIPSAIQIFTKDRKEYFFASFVLRDQAFLKIASLLHASRKSSEKSIAEISPPASEKPAAAVVTTAAVSESGAVVEPASPPPAADSIGDWEDLVMRNSGVLLGVAALVAVWSVVAIVSSGTIAWKVLRAVNELDALFGLL